MWIRKSEEEIQAYLKQQEKKKKSLLRPFLFALILTIGAMLLYTLGYRGGWWRGGMVLVSRRGGFDTGALNAGVFMFALFFIVAVYNQSRFGASSPSVGDSLLCRECKEPLHSNASGVCGCGGKLEPFTFFSWIEDEEPAPSET